MNARGGTQRIGAQLVVGALEAHGVTHVFGVPGAAGRAVSSLLQTQGVGDLYRIYLTAQRDGVDFNLAYVPPSFTTPHTKDFDTAYMQALFKVGYDLGAAGYEWRKEPPGYTAPVSGP